MNQSASTTRQNRPPREVRAQTVSKLSYALHLSRQLCRSGALFAFMAASFFAVPASIYTLAAAVAGPGLKSGMFALISVSVTTLTLAGAAFSARAINSAADLRPLTRRTAQQLRPAEALVRAAAAPSGESLLRPTGSSTEQGDELLRAHYQPDDDSQAASASYPQVDTASPALSGTDHHAAQTPQ